MHKYINIRLVHYVDDSTAYKILDSLSWISEVKAELSKISDWLCASRLSLNVTKSYFSIYSNIVLKSIPVINVRGQSLPRSSQVKFMGAMFDEKLSFAERVNSVCTKVSLSVGMIEKTFNFHTLKIVNMSVFHTYLPLY